MRSLIAPLLIALSFSARSQYMEKVPFDTSDSTNGYYLAIPPTSGNIKGVLVFFTFFRGPESMLPETRLHNIASASDLLTIYASTGRKVTADAASLGRMNTILQHVVTKYKADTATFILGGFDMAGMTALRYTERAYENPSQWALRPKAVFAVSSFVDLSGLYHWCERQIKKNYPPTVGDGRGYMDMLTKEAGTITDHPETYKKASPFWKEDDAPGNEQYLYNLPLRLYYDTDIAWQLTARRNSLYDTNIPDGTELINRLLLAGDKKAEFISSKQPGVRSNGMRNASALSIVDETDCIQWIKKILRIFDPNNPLAWVAPYRLPLPDGWNMERSTFPGPNSPHIAIRGMEDIRFPPGWGNPKSEEYWSVAYMNWLDGGQKIDATILQDNLKIYYDDLIAGALIRRNLNISADKITPTRVTIKQQPTEAGDLETYTGTVTMFDYLGQHPITLNFRGHVKDCSARGHIPLFWELSPQPFEHPIWNEFKKIRDKFNCEE